MGQLEISSFRNSYFLNLLVRCFIFSEGAENAHSRTILRTELLQSFV